MTQGRLTFEIHILSAVNRTQCCCYYYIVRRSIPFSCKLACYNSRWVFHWGAIKAHEINSNVYIYSFFILIIKNKNNTIITN